MREFCPYAPKDEVELLRCLEMEAPMGGFVSFPGGSIDLPDWDLGPISFEPPTIGIPPITIGGGGSARDQAVQIVNGFEPLFGRNRDAFAAGQISAGEAKQTFESLWSQMVSQLSRLGAEGQRAINDRAPGGKFDWWSAYDRFPGQTVTPLLPRTPEPGFPQPVPGVPEQPAPQIDLGKLALFGGLAYLLMRRR